MKNRIIKFLSKLTLAEKISSIGILIAVVTSLGTFYFSFIHQNDDLNAQITLEKLEGYTAFYEVTLINAGTREISLLKISGMISPDADFEFRSESKKLSNTIILPPSSTKTVNIAHNIIFETDSIRYDSKVVKYYSGIKFEIIDLNGNLHKSVVPHLTIEKGGGNYGSGTTIHVSHGIVNLITGSSYQTVVSRDIGIKDSFILDFNNWILK